MDVLEKKSFQNINTLFFCRIPFDEFLEQSTEKLKNRGHDQEELTSKLSTSAIPPKALKIGAEELSKPLTTLFNLCLF